MAATPLTLDSITALAAAIEQTRGAPLSIGESSRLKSRYHQLVRATAGSATVTDLAGIVADLLDPVSSAHAA